MKILIRCAILFLIVPVFAAKQYVSPEDMKKMCYELYTKIKKDDFKPDLLLGLARGGLIPLGYLAGEKMFNQRSVYSLGVQSYEGMEQQTEIKFTTPLDLKYIQQFKNILLIDDLVDTGKTIKYVKEVLRTALPEETNIRVAVLFYKPKNSKIKPDYYVEETDSWLVFPQEE